MIFCPTKKLCVERLRSRLGQSGADSLVGAVCGGEWRCVCMRGGVRLRQKSQCLNEMKAQFNTQFGPLFLSKYIYPSKSIHTQTHTHIQQHACARQ